jgi:hypothetical protein
MSSDSPDGRIKPPAVDATVDTQDEENGRAESWQAGPSNGTVSNDEYTRDSHKSTERTHRTGLRRAANHASWREVYRACHVGVGMNE